MELKLIDLLERIQENYPDKEYFEGGVFTQKPVYKGRENKLEIDLSLEAILPYEVWDIFCTRLTTLTKCRLDMTISAKQSASDILNVSKYVHHYVSLHPTFKVFRDFLPRLEENKYLIYSIGDDHLREFAIQNKHEVQGFLKRCGFCLEILVEERKPTMSIQTVAVKEEPKPVKVYEEKKAMSFKPKKKGLDQYVPFAIHDITEECHGIRIKGKIFETEIRTLRNEKDIQMLWIADEQDAIVMKRFERGAITKEVLREIQTGDYVVAYSKVEYDNFTRDLVFMPDVIEKVAEVKRIDDAEEKRVELHVHTKLSEMDGVCGIEEYIETANEWGMNAIACTDHLVVQAFPKAQHKVAAINKKRETPFKMIYGIEMNMVDPYLQIVRNVKEIGLEEGTYCVFDLETTGLSSRFDHIIEFGGQIVKDRTCIKSLQLFIKPPVPIPAHIVELTGISEEHVRNAKSFAECADQILDFIGDSILVAHNADFDYNFLNSELVRIGRKPLDNPVIDTLDLARSMQDRKGYRLGQIARSYGIRYDEDVAHRADYDAEVLANTYMNMLNDLKHIQNLAALQDMQNARSFTKVRAKHVTILVKNAAGLKELFELVTLSHTKYLSYSDKSTGNIVAEPRILREEIEKRRRNGNLLIGSSCLNGEVFDVAQTRGEEELLKVMQFYDYIELQPLGNYRHLVERDSIESMDRLKEILRSIVEAAKKCGKRIIASGDVHYVHPNEKMIRDIYISSQAIGGIRHPLYIYNQEKRRKFKSPDQHLLTTKEMLKEFAWLGEKEAYTYVVTNTNAIADMIEVVKPVKDRLYPPDIEGSDQKLIDICYENAHKKYGPNLPDIVEERLKRELDSIIGHGFYVVYYISHLLVKKSLNDGYLVGSRGSVGSSFVATMAEITEVNPLAPHYVCPKCHYVKFFTDGSVADGFDLPDIQCPNCGETIRGDGHDIPFETFLGFEGDKVPDIDLNFSGDYQPTAHAYTKEVFGEDHVYRAGTIGTVATQTAFGYVKGYQEEMGIEGGMRNAQVLRLAKGCEGVKRTTGQHPGGIIVIPLDLDVHDFTPVQYPANNPNADWKTTHFEFHDIHDNVLKFDILGHVDPTAMRMLQRISGVDPVTIPMNDPETMSIFSKVDALKIDTSKACDKTGAAGLPEFGTKFVRGILELTEPTTFDELLKISGLSHGTDVWLGNAKDLIDQNICTLKSVIGCRDDIMVYLLHKGLEPKLAFTIMESVRKGKGLRDEWIPEMKKHGVEDWYIESCKKIKYMFPKAHATAYVMMAIRIAWFKVHLPQYYYCMFFSIRCDAYDIQTMIQGEQAIRRRMNDIDERLRNNETKRDVSKKDKDIYNTLELALEMVLRGYFFRNIDLNRSASNEFIVDPDNDHYLIPPFTSIDGLGENVADTVVEARKHGAFLSKEDLQRRTSLSGTLIKTLESMGVLEGLQDENQMSLFG
ncbi:PolC-type DNA polymerase III [Amedibacillus dolichus]|uniref:PolC-type DNA polymerase III n=1 Tax=Amedibacillus dolichus TaxID=31971 RepID=UPI0026741D48|nr:PolC-type DNA polymerase III [Amedibacillus dolichus]